MVLYSLIYFAVTLILTIALTPRPPTPRPASTADFSLPTADQGRNIPVIFGTVDITGSNVVWYGDLQAVPWTKSSLFSSQTVGYFYFLGIHHILGHGPFDSIIQMSWDQHVCWYGNVTETTESAINTYSYYLYGGPGNGGGVVGSFDVVMGYPTDGVNAYLTAQLGTVPAYRGLVSAIWKTGNVTADFISASGVVENDATYNCGYVGMAPYVRGVSFRCTRAVQGWNTEGGCWYPSKAIVQTNTQIDSPPQWTFSWESSLGDAAVNDSQTTIYYDEGDANLNAFTLGLLYIGPPTGGEWMLVTAVTGDIGSDNPANFTLTVVRGYFGSTPQAWPALTAFYFWQVQVGPINHMNPAHIIYQCLTDPFWGMGMPISQIDNTSFEAAADVFYDEGTGLDFQWVNASTVQDFLKIVIDHCAACVVMNNQTGLMQLIPIRGGYDISDLDVFDETQIKSMENFETQGWAEVVNEVVLVYTDPSSGRNTSLTGQDLGVFDIQGGLVSQTLNYQGIRDHTIAANTLGRELMARTTPLVKVKFKINRVAWTVNYGGVFVLNWAPQNVTGMVIRVTNISSGTIDDNEIEIEGIQDIYSLSYYNYMLPTSVPQVVAPTVVGEDMPSTGTTVISSTETTPPTTPANGDRYVVPADATGAWAGEEGTVAIWNANSNPTTGGAWEFYPIPTGSQLYDSSSGNYVTTNSSGGVVTLDDLQGESDIIQQQVFS